MDFITARRTPYLLLVLCAFVSGPASAQTAPWTTPLRGSWVQTGPAAQGDIVLAAKDGTSQIVDADGESPAEGQTPAPDILPVRTHSEEHQQKRQHNGRLANNGALVEAYPVRERYRGQHH